MSCSQQIVTKKISHTHTVKDITDFNQKVGDLLVNYLPLSGGEIIGDLSANNIFLNAESLTDLKILNYDSNYDTVNTLSAAWNMGGGGDNDTTTIVQNYSANWNDVATIVDNNSASNWNYQGTDIKTLTGNWQNTYTSFNIQSANNASVYSTVNTISAAIDTIQTDYLPLSGGTMTESAAIAFQNGSRLVQGTTDQFTGGNKGISLRCSIDYELNYQAGRLTNYEQDGSTVRTLPLGSPLSFLSGYNLLDSSNINSINPNARILYNANGDVILDWSGATLTGVGIDSTVPTQVYTNSANWNDVVTIVTNNSASNWNYQGTDIKTLTSDWQDTLTVVTNNSAIWVLSGLTIETDPIFTSWATNNSALFLNTYNTVQSNSASNWNYQGTDIKTLTGDWQHTFTTFSIQSANNLSVYTNTNSNSATNASVYTTVNESSAVWNNTTKYLPLSGGILTGNLDIHADISSVNSIYFNLTGGAATLLPGQLSWNSTEATLNLGVDTDVSIQLGQENLVQVKNTSNNIIYNGAPVYASGASGMGSGNITVSAYRAGATDIDELYFLGVATQELAINGIGFVTTFGKVRNVTVSEIQAIGDTGPLNTWAIGTVLYPSPLESGRYVSTSPSAPNRSLPIALVISVNGSHRNLFIRASTGYHLNELHDVSNGVPLDGDVLTYSTLSSVWYSRTTYQGTDIKSLTGNWQNTFTNFSIQSANNVSVYSEVNSASSNWDIAYNQSNIFANNSANYNNIVTTVQNNSAIWVLSGGTVSVENDPIFTSWSQSNSANYQGTFVTVQANSAVNWNYQGTDVKSLTSTWQNTFTDFSVQSANNVSNYTTVNTSSANWLSNYTSFNTQSGNNASVYSYVNSISANNLSNYTTVNTYSATWNAGGGGGIDTEVRALTGNWQSTFTTVNTNSASWGTGGSGGTTVTVEDANLIIALSMFI